MSLKLFGGRRRRHRGSRRMSCPPSTTDSTERSWMTRFSATAALLPVLQLARRTRRYSISGATPPVLRREDLGQVRFECPLFLAARLSRGREAWHLHRGACGCWLSISRMCARAGRWGGLRRTLQHFARASSSAGTFSTPAATVVMSRYPLLPISPKFPMETVPETPIRAGSP